MFHFTRSRLNFEIYILAKTYFCEYIDRRTPDGRLTTSRGVLFIHETMTYCRSILSFSLLYTHF